MKKLGMGVLGTALVLSTAAARWMGGWAVVTVENVPEYLVVGKSQVLEFWVRQHGVTPMPDLTPSVVARSGSRVVRGRAWATPTTGAYRASITVPAAADWEIMIESGFGASKGRLLPLKAVDSTQKVAALSVADRGRQLFAAKGCVGCHVHRAVDLKGDMQDVGPDLSDRRFAPDYLAKYLADPSVKPQSPNTMRMPNLALREPEIASLIAFINSERRLSNR